MGHQFSVLALVVLTVAGFTVLYLYAEIFLSLAAVLARVIGTPIALAAKAGTRCLRSAFAWVSQEAAERPSLLLFGLLALALAVISGYVDYRLVSKTIKVLLPWSEVAMAVALLMVTTGAVIGLAIHRAPGFYRVIPAIFFVLLVGLHAAIALYRQQVVSAMTLMDMQASGVDPASSSMWMPSPTLILVLAVLAGIIAPIAETCGTYVAFRCAGGGLSYAATGILLLPLLPLIGLAVVLNLAFVEGNRLERILVGLVNVLLAVPRSVFSLFSAHGPLWSWWMRWLAATSGAASDRDSVRNHEEEVLSTRLAIERERQRAELARLQHRRAMQEELRLAARKELNSDLVALSRIRAADRAAAEEVEENRLKMFLDKSQPIEEAFMDSTLAAATESLRGRETTAGRRLADMFTRGPSRRISRFVRRILLLEPRGRNNGTHAAAAESAIALEPVSAQNSN